VYSIFMVTQILRCSRCDSTDVIRHGKDRKGVQRYRCRACAYTFREDPKPKGYTEEEKQQILAAYRERMSMRGLTRVFGVSRSTVATWLREEAETLSPPGGDASAGRVGGRSGAG
jgi:transposase-like protein